MGGRRGVGLAGTALLACWAGLSVTACSSSADRAVVGAQPVPTASIYVLAPTGAGIAVETEPPTLASFRRNAEGVVLPDREVTTGTFFGDVTASDICQLHYTQGVRQPRFNDKVEAFANYGISIRERDVYAVDHLVPISLGGNNTIENLWPQPYDDYAGADQKNLLERQLRGLVCSNLLPLADAQQAIATDWWSAYGTYMGLAILPGSAGPEPWDRPTQAAGEVVNGGVCSVEGEVGYTEPKRVLLTCTLTSFGELRWQKRY